MDKFELRLTELLGTAAVKTQEMMKNHTTFRIGGPASYFVVPDSSSQLSAVVRLCRDEEVPYVILGNGSNLLVGDLGYEGVVIVLGEEFSRCRIEADRITAGGGVKLSVIARRALEAGLTGFEFAGGIPGTLGGALVMNAGAYGGEMKDVLESARVMTREGEVLTLTAEQLELGYRTSCIPSNGYILLEGTIRLQPGDPSAIEASMKDLAGRRRDKQPLEFPSAGSTFKRPAGHFAGKLIEEAGLRGYQVGGAQVSEKHCGFVINTGDATAADVLTLCRDVRDRVEQLSGVVLEMEIKKLGRFE
ncbi:MAG: UDP-N-acetylmuramate dehydrogenase [Lachnospiraceae bacterium]